MSSYDETSLTDDGNEIKPVPAAVPRRKFGARLFAAGSLVALVATFGLFVAAFQLDGERAEWRGRIDALREEKQKLSTQIDDAKTAISALEGRASESRTLRREIKGLVADKKRLQSEDGKLLATISGQNAKRVGLERTLKDLNSSIDEQGLRIRDIQSKARSLESDQERGRNEFENEKQEWKRQRSSIKNQIAIFERDAKAAQVKWDKAKSSLDLSEQSLRVARQDFKQKSIELEKLTTKVNTQNARKDVLSVQISGKMEQLSKLESDILAAQVRIPSAREKIVETEAKLTSLRETLRRLADEETISRTSFQILETKNSKLRDEVDSLTANKSRNQAVNQLLTESQAALAIIQEKTDAARTTLHDLNTRTIEQGTALRSSKDQRNILQRDIDNLEGVKMANESVVADLSKNRQKLAVTIEQIASAKRQLSGNQSQLNRVQAIIEANKNQRQESLDKKLALEQEIDRLKGIEASFETLTGNISAKRRTISQLRTDIKVADGQLKEAVDETERLIIQAKGLKAEIDDIGPQVGRNKTTLVQLKKQVGSASTEVATLEAKHSELGREIANKEKRQSALSGRIAGLIETEQHLNTNIAGQNDRLTTIKAEIEIASGALATKRDQSTDLDKRVQERQRQRGELRARIDSLRQARASLEGQRDGLIRQIQILKSAKLSFDNQQPIKRPSTETILPSQKPERTGSNRKKESE